MTCSPVPSSLFPAGLVPDFGLAGTAPVPHFHWPPAPAPLSAQAKEAARRIFSGEEEGTQPCPDCGGVHARACPRIKSESVVLSAEGQIVQREVHYWPPGQWEAGIVFADDAFEKDDGEGGNSPAGAGAVA